MNVEPEEVVGAKSTADPAFRSQAYAAVEARGEVLVGYFMANAGGWQEWHLVRSRSELETLLNSGKSRSIFDIYVTPQLPIRGVADSVRENAVVSALRSAGEVALALPTGGHSFLEHLGTCLDWGGTDEEAEVHAWFLEHAGEEIVAGPEPSLSAPAEPEVLSARVPDPDGKIRKAAF